MWKYEKRLQYPVDIKKPDARLAKVIMSQFGGLNCKRL
ncbi:MAG: manganese catalase family protein [Clostridia bacterium]|nr:manganese catalase family protein [Clostridia bacterium]